MKNIAIIGAGLAGLALAKQLQPYAHVQLFEKSRGVSGRMSTRRSLPYHFDHGAQFFTAQTPAFKAFLQPLLEQGVVRVWHAKFAEFNGSVLHKTRQWDDDFPHYVGAPAMNAMNKFLATDLHVTTGTRITRIEKMATNNSPQWLLHDENGQTYGHFDWVISSAPAEQTAALMPADFAHHQHVAATKMQACFALMLGFEKPLTLDFQAAKVNQADISWISVNSSKPQRPEGYSLLVHSTNAWADAHIDDDKDDVINYLCQQTVDVIGRSLDSANHKAVHGWRYANLPTQPEHEVLIDHANQLAACGDWCIKGKVEAAFSSSQALGNALIDSLST